MNLSRFFQTYGMPVYTLPTRPYKSQQGKKNVTDKTKQVVSVHDMFLCPTRETRYSTTMLLP